MRRPIRHSVWVYLFFAGLASGEIQTQHAFDSSLRIGRFNPLWHLRLRTKPEGGGLFQVRTGPIFEFDLAEHVTAIAGYYFTRQQEGRSWTTTNRLFGGGEVAVWERAVEVDWRSLLERFAVAHEPDYFRFRNRIRFSPPRDTAPYASIELFTDAKGVRSTRYSAGVRRSFGEDVIIDFGYFFEDRRPNPAGERHMFATTFHWRNKTRRVDPDF